MKGKVYFAIRTTPTGCLEIFAHDEYESPNALLMTRIEREYAVEMLVEMLRNCLRKISMDEQAFCQPAMTYSDFQEWQTTGELPPNYAGGDE